jgi:uncharacterized protein YdcH (DUF465 family)
VIEACGCECRNLVSELRAENERLEGILRRDRGDEYFSPHARKQLFEQGAHLERVLAERDELRAELAKREAGREVFDVPVLEHLRKDFDLVDLGLASGHDGFGDRTAGRAAIKRIRGYFDGCDRLEEFTTAIASMVSNPFRVTTFPGESDRFHGGDIHDVARLQQRVIERLRGELAEAKDRSQRAVLTAAEAALSAPDQPPQPARPIVVGGRWRSNVTGTEWLVVPCPIDGFALDDGDSSITGVSEQTLRANFTHVSDPPASESEG